MSTLQQLQCHLVCKVCKDQHAGGPKASKVGRDWSLPVPMLAAPMWWPRSQSHLEASQHASVSPQSQCVGLGPEGLVHITAILLLAAE